MENFATYRLTQTGPETQAILDQVNENTTDIAQLRALYEALTQSDPVIIQPSDPWPVADPEENVIYRVIDRVNTPPESYSDYMWNGTEMVLMATYDNAIDSTPTAGSNNPVASGGVLDYVSTNGSAYDISAANSGTTYADLAAALGTDGANVPAAVRKGGMSVKFVQTSDNKYVQYFLTKDEWSASEGDWEKINLEEEVGQLGRKVGTLDRNAPKVVNDDSDASLNVTDENGNVLAKFKNGGIRTKNFDSRNVVGVASDDSDASLNVTDENGNVLAKFKNGGIRTKNFDSRNVVGVASDDSDASLNVTDENGNVLARFAGGHIRTKNFNSEDARTSKKIKALFIGNSISQDHITYLPWLLKNTYGSSIDFTIGIFYIGGESIAEYADAITTNGDVNADIFSIAENTEKWTNTGNYPLSQAVGLKEWDIVTLEPYIEFRVSEHPELADQAEDLTKTPIVVDFIKAHAIHPFELGVVLHQTYNRLGDNMIVDISEGAVELLSKYGMDLVFPCGYATEYCKSFITTSDLTPDNLHNNEGLPCIIGAYVVMACITRRLGLPIQILGNPNRITAAKYQELSIPGPNGTLKDFSGNETIWFKAQIASTKAVIAGDGLYEHAAKGLFDTIINH